MFHPDLIRHPDSCPTLVLNADYTPLSYYPLSIWPWQTAVKAVFLDRVDIVAHYEREVRSPTQSIKLPSVIALKQYVRPSQFPAFTRFNLFLRDKFSCQYCGSAQRDLRKGGRTPREAAMPLHIEPIRPTSWQLQEHGRRFPPNYLHATWRDWLYWDVELEA